MTANDSAALSKSPASRAGFPVTCWSMVIDAGSESKSRSLQALETLCRVYWYPLYAFARYQGRSHHEAEDCTQAFLSSLLASESLTRVRPELGRFRTFLLTSFRYYLINEWHRNHAQKRGGNTAVQPLEFSTADLKFSHEPADRGLTPEEQFDRNWALEMIERAITELRQEYQKTERSELFEVLGTLLWGREDRATYASAATRLNMSVRTLSVALHRLRRRLGDRLRRQVAETVTENAEIDIELRHLIAAASRR